MKNELLDNIKIFLQIFTIEYKEFEEYCDTLAVADRLTEEPSTFYKGAINNTVFHPQQVQIHSGNSSPLNPVVGSLFFNTTINQVMLYNGQQWSTINSGSPGMYEDELKEKFKLFLELKHISFSLYEKFIINLKGGNYSYGE